MGIGPGSIDHMSGRAVEVLKSVETVAGYTTYIDLVVHLIEGKHIVSTGMTKEVDRVRKAIDIAVSGSSCAIICSGDPGIYAMAGLAFEICEKKQIHIIPPSGALSVPEKGPALTIEIVPGIPALASGASLLGAPLTHDFSAISLSDLLTPWERIEKRIEAAAKADFVIVLYNPKSKKRSSYLEKAQKIVLKYRDKMTPVGIVVSAMRERQSIAIVPLEALHTAYADMQTTVFIGNSTTRKYMDFMFTPRGYAEKYNLGKS